MSRPLTIVRPLAPFEPPRRWLLHILALTVGVVLVLASATPVWASDREAEAEVVARMADARAAAGVGPLARSSELDRIATDWARQMAADGQLSHNPRLAEQVAPADAHAENVGRVAGPSAAGREGGATLHRSWMDSAGHRANIEGGSFDEVGVGIIRDGDQLWASVVFRGGGSSGGSAAADDHSSEPSREGGDGTAHDTPAPPAPSAEPPGSADGADEPAAEPARSTTPPDASVEQEPDAAATRTAEAEDGEGGTHGPAPAAMTLPDRLAPVTERSRQPTRPDTVARGSAAHGPDPSALGATSIPTATAGTSWTDPSLLAGSATTGMLGVALLVAWRRRGGAER